MTPLQASTRRWRHREPQTGLVEGHLVGASESVPSPSSPRRTDAQHPQPGGKRLDRAGVSISSGRRTRRATDSMPKRGIGGDLGGRRTRSHVLGALGIRD